MISNVVVSSYDGLSEVNGSCFHRTDWGMRIIAGNEQQPILYRHLELEGVRMSALNWTLAMKNLGKNDSLFPMHTPSEEHARKVIRSSCLLRVE